MPRNHESTLLKAAYFMNSPMMILKQYDDLGLAHLDRARLENEGIFCILEDENMTSLAWHLSNALGGIKLKVKREDFQKSIELLQPIETGTQCPKCSSQNVVHQKLNLTSAIVGIILALIPGPSRSKWICNDCMHSWK